MSNPNRSIFKSLSTSVSAFALILGMLSTSAMAAYPERPITLIVPWGAGGGTDATGRMIGSLLEKELGQPVNVVNRTGGSGVDAHPEHDRILAIGRGGHDRWLFCGATLCLALVCRHARF